jgi:hypothetical protein
LLEYPGAPETPIPPVVLRPAASVFLSAFVRPLSSGTRPASPGCKVSWPR